MANQKITDLPAGSRMRADDLIEVVQAGVSKQISLDEISPGPDAPPATANAMDDEFDAATLDAKWTWRNQGTGTATFSKSRLNLKCPASGTNCRILEQNTPATPYIFEMKMMLLSTAYAIATYHKTGFCLVESSTGKLVLWGPGSNGGPVFQVNYFSSVTAYAAAPAAVGVPLMGVWYYLRLEDNGTNLIFSLSFDGTVWIVVATIGRTAYLAGGANRIGIFSNTENGSTDCHTIVEYFRRVS